MAEPPRVVSLPKVEPVNIPDQLRALADDMEQDPDPPEVVTVIIDGTSFTFSRNDDRRLFADTVTNLVSGLFDMFLPDEDDA